MILEDIIAEFDKKEKLFLIGDVQSYTVLSNLKANRFKYYLTSKKQHEIFKLGTFMLFLQFTLVFFEIQLCFDTFWNLSMDLQ